ncbi:MAG TPA: Flp pilus assembly protein CpaB [Nevskia sp.]|nr:Flp pilus assembly protein CpaB [Nevskia sp.]
MSSNLIKIIAGVFVLLAVILGFVAWKMGHDYADNSNRVAQQSQAVQAAAAPQYDVVVAGKLIQANQPIDKDSVRVVKLEVVPSSGYYTKVDDVIGLVPLLDVDSGTPLTPQLIKGNPVAKQLPPGTKAVSLTLNDVIGVGGFVRPGDIVDVLVYLRNDQSNKVDPAQARILQKDALVLAFDDHVLMPAPVDKNNPNGQQQQQQQQQRRERTVVVAVPDAEVTRVMLGASLGEVRLALHGQNSEPAQAAAAAPAAPGAAAPAAAGPTPVSGASLAPQQTAMAGAAARSDSEQQLPDQPYTSEDLAKLKPKRPVSKAAPQGIVIYRGSKASTVYP